MSAQDPRPAPRRRKLVLRKIADAPVRAAAPAAPISYTGPVSTIRPPPQPPVKAKPSLMLPFESEPAIVDPGSEPALEEPDEVEPEEATALEEVPALKARDPFASPVADEWHASDAAAAAMTPAIPRAARVPAWPATSAQALPPSFPFVPTLPGVGGAAAQRRTPAASTPWGSPAAVTPAPSRAPAAPGASVAPVVATLLPPMGGAPRLAPARGRLSADSKLLVGGGALAAAMLLVATGVLLGQRSREPAPVSAAASGPYPVVVDTRAPAATALPAAESPPPIETRPAVSEPAVAKATKAEGPTTVNVQQLPPATRPGPQGWSVVGAAPTSKAPGSGAATGWSVASPLLPRAPAGVGDRQARATGVAPGEPAVAADSAAAAAPEPSTSAPSAPAPVDPLVQAVRDDIREDEARTK